MIIYKYKGNKNKENVVLDREVFMNDTVMTVIAIFLAAILMFM